MKSTLIPGIKAAIGRGIYATPWPRRFLRDKFLITAFHRVNAETIGDSISCSPRNFRDICVWLSRHFDVVPLSEQIRALENGKILPGSASITFDDGYLDNFEIAAPILRELNLPATFFLTTDLIETAVTPYWDAANNIQTRWMTWDHVSELIRQGFEVESHTCTHIDLGKVDSNTAVGEFRRSVSHLARVNAARTRTFSYPFGGRENITEPMRALVKAEGFRCCMSCYGGLNAAGADPFSLVRMPVNEEYQYPYQFGLEVLRSTVE